MVPLALLAGCAVAPLISAANQLIGDVAPQGALTEAYTWLLTALVAGVAVGNAASRSDRRRRRLARRHSWWRPPSGRSGSRRPSCGARRCARRWPPRRCRTARSATASGRRPSPTRAGAGRRRSRRRSGARRGGGRAGRGCRRAARRSARSARGARPAQLARRRRSPADQCAPWMHPGDDVLEAAEDGPPLPGGLEGAEARRPARRPRRTSCSARRSPAERIGVCGRRARLSWRPCQSA